MRNWSGCCSGVFGGVCCLRGGLVFFLVIGIVRCFMCGLRGILRRLSWIRLSMLLNVLSVCFVMKVCCFLSFGFIFLRNSLRNVLRCWKRICSIVGSLVCWIGSRVRFMIVLCIMVSVCCVVLVGIMCFGMWWKVWMSVIVF